MTSYDYQKLIEEACKLLQDLIGKRLIKVLVNVVDPEFNVVYLVLDNEIYTIAGEIGGEYLGIKKHQKPTEISNIEGSIIVEYEPFELFIGHKIVQARQIGTAWNGHGFEFSFDGIHDKTMIIQSIYVKNKPTGLEDCLRLGIAEYQLTY